MAPEAGLEARAWRGIDDLAELVGAYSWLENRIFELSGAWATGTGTGTHADPTAGLEPAVRVWCAGLSRRHGLLAVRWAERLPVRAGVDRAALVAAPGGPLAAALHTLGAAADRHPGVTALVDAVLPCLQRVYGEHWRTASPVSEASVLEVLAGAHRDLSAEIEAGRTALEGSSTGLTTGGALVQTVEQAFAETDVFPAVRAS